MTSPTDYIIQAWVADGYAFSRGATYDRGLQMFDRWLAQHDRELREQIAGEIEADIARLDDGSLNAFGMGQEYAAKIARGDHHD
jgi:hypothetical protein